jgi:hypothetical protein
VCTTHIIIMSADFMDPFCGRNGRELQPGTNKAVPEREREIEREREREREREKTCQINNRQRRWLLEGMHGKMQKENQLGVGKTVH